MISKQLLAATNFSAPAIVVYGGPGLKKSLAIHSLPPPVLDLQFEEGGSSPILPWIARVRDYNEKTWRTFSQEDRLLHASLLNEKVKKSYISPAPYIDVIKFDVTKAESWEHLKETLGNLDYKYYSSVALDSLQEMSWTSRSFTKGAARMDQTMQSIPFSWSRAQEYVHMALRNMRVLTKEGIVTYMVGSQGISKDYVKSPYEKEKGEQTQEPYSVKGTVDLPGQLADALPHQPDILCHAVLINNEPAWFTEPQMLPGGVAWWDAKDRYGRLPKLITPDVKAMFIKLYGEEGMKVIYGAAKASLVA